jgi:hypothetical protein
MAASVHMQKDGVIFDFVLYRKEEPNLIVEKLSIAEQFRMKKVCTERNVGWFLRDT